MDTISVIISTYSRAMSLSRALKSILGVRYPPEQWEIIVADNGGREDTRAIALS